jgi:NAD(P)-dependent dehydrogenase (short-subunit alcohol dehydrogenase family)
MTNSKDVVVTGVSTGIGWGTTKVLVSKGFRVFGSVRKQADADRLQGELGMTTARMTRGSIRRSAPHTPDFSPGRGYYFPPGCSRRAGGECP